MFVDNFYVNKDDTEDVRSIHLTASCLKREMTIPNRLKSFKWLVVYTDDIDSLPPYFREQFEVISLEPVNQDTPVSTPQDTPERQKTSISEAEQGVTTLFYDDAKGILFLEDGKKM